MTRPDKAAWGRALRPVAAALFGLLVGVALTGLSGDNPLDVLRVIIKGAFGSAYDFGMTLFYTTPLILTGLAVALPFKAGLFNIGAEGQLTVGALAAALVGVYCPGLPGYVALTLGAAAGFAAGALWGVLPGWVRAYRGGHEVITTIMMNFIAAGLASWVILNLIPAVDSQNPESAHVGPGYVLTAWSAFGGAPVTMALAVAVLVAVGVWVYLRFTVRGFELKATGLSLDGAHVAGVNVRLQQVGAMALAGGIAGLVGLAEVYGNAGRYRLGFSPDYGFIGIPVALVARAHPLGLIVSALLFGALQKGTSDLDLETAHVTRDLALLIQAMVVLAVSAEGGLTLLTRKRKAHKTLAALTGSGGASAPSLPASEDKP